MSEEKVASEEKAASECSELQSAVSILVPFSPSARPGLAYANGDALDLGVLSSEVLA